MLIKSRRRWEMPESLATPESIFLNRRQILAGFGLGAGMALIGGRQAYAASIEDLFPAKNNPAFKLDRDVTPEETNLTYNNFYEFGTSKYISEAAQALAPRPWAVTIDGLVEAEKTIDVDDLIRSMPIEERLYRHRCVEAWSMAIPWTGFPLKALVAAAKPTSDARYIRFETFMNPDVAPEQAQPYYPWPYVEGLTIEEANNDLAFMVVGAYGKVLANQFGAPLRLATPWKYGFKSAKSIAKISFVADRPETFWAALGPSEYGFWANVNPEVSHPRWSQASERLLTTGESVPTQLFNGYAEEVAGLYKGLESEALYM